ncbi:LPS export ABC transporter periplasmic protein LptC [Roseicyclus sp.]|uniref:LPS export ABC transporter periplasmic protein LptC n=1 Tax=Roseicyclus sp. TaxID=1914329 RepID=UPI003F6A6422
MAGPNRYSTLVSWAKVLLPLTALGLLSTLFLFSRTPNPQDALLFNDVDIGQLGSERLLTEPRFAGILGDGQPVTLTADNAVQRMDDPNRLQMDRVETDVALKDGQNLHLTADRGAYDATAQIVDLDGAVNAQTTTGFQLISDRIVVALTAMEMTSPGAVMLRGPGMMLEAGAMQLTGPEGQALLHFTGGVRLLYDTQN